MLTAGESHGRALTGILDGMPAGVPVDLSRVNEELRKRQGGHGRGGRMRIEHDEIDILSGVRFGRTTGAPISFQVRNMDFVNWERSMAVQGPAPSDVRRVTLPRPGHADLTGALKYGHDDIRNIIERSSARETAARVAAGALCKEMLSVFGVTWASHVVRIGPVAAKMHDWTGRRVPPGFVRGVESSPVRCADRSATRRMISAIESAKRRGNTLGGIYEIVFFNLPPGLGSCMQWDGKLDARLAMGILSIQAQKAVEVGDGWAAASRPGSEVHDEIRYSRASGFHRSTNRAGGIEGGMTNGEPVVVRGAMKPIASLLKPLRTVDLSSRKSVVSRYERSDVCAVPAAGIVAENVLAFVLADAFLEKFSGDHCRDVAAALQHYRRRIR